MGGAAARTAGAGAGGRGAAAAGEAERAECRAVPAGGTECAAAEGGRVLHLAVW